MQSVTTPANSFSRRSLAKASLSLLGVAALALTGCATGTATDGGGAEPAGGTVTLVTHGTFPSDDFAKAASAATGYDVKVVSAGDGGELTNKLVLTKGAPIADAFFGVDTIFASRLIENGVVTPYAPADLPAQAADFAVESAKSDETGAAAIAANGMVPVDFGATCINIDTGWFAEHKVAEPNTYEDLVKPEYKDLTVLLDPTASSTGASFLVGTVEEFGEDGYADYWKQLVDNGARIEQGWSDAYYGQFTQGGEDGTKPIVVSYASSPAFSVAEDGKSAATRALLDTCTRQTEYAGVLAGAKNEKGAKAVVDYLVSNEFQATVPDTMYMAPIDESVKLPESWATFAPEPAKEQSHDLNSDVIEQGREGWLRELGDAIGL